MQQISMNDERDKLMKTHCLMTLLAVTFIMITRAGRPVANAWEERRLT
jgi:hypothetical protein